MSGKTAQRAIDFLRDRLFAPLEYSRENRGWFYSQNTYSLPAVMLTEGDLLTLVLASRLVREYRGSAIGGMIEATFAKVLDAMTDKVSIHLASLAESYSFEAAPANELDPDLLLRLGRAVLDHKTVSITYYTAARGAVSERKVDPIHLRNYVGEWYLVAFDHNRRQVRDFHAARIRRREATDVRFRLPDGFDLKAYLESGFQMIRGSRQFDVELIFDEYQSRWIRERPKFHPSEQREELPGGELKLRMQLSALDSVKRFVMQYGAHVRVTAPEELRASIRDEIDKMRAAYESKC
ncbi:MAG: helix-turn-helix transcriptional regulator [Blastocatellia bacterium]